MKLIDKYLLATFLVPLGYCLAAFTLVYVIFDLFDHLNDFVEGQTPIGDVITYYIVLMPSVLVFIVPISLLLAVLYSLSSLTKNNEITAMRASGISMIRLMTPFLLVGLLASLGVLAVNETVGPDAAWWSKKFVTEQRKADPDDVHTAELAFHKDNANRFWYIQRFDTRDFSMRRIEVIQMGEDNQEEYKLNAAEGRWLDGYWVFTDITIQYYDDEGNPRGPARQAAFREMTEFNEKPSDFLSEIKPPEFMSSRELLRYLRVNRNLQAEAKLRRTVDLHFRLAQPWTCFIVTLLGIPFGNQTGRKGALRGFVLSIGLFFGYYALINFGLYLGKGGLLPPWLAGWSPNMIFFTTGVILIYRMR
ncbi:MAG TPA: LptF/LptG family permease [Kiritimatiellia bacterium]|nr:LptF/LptG family permease [Kiritimatiellia bacterium]HMO98852.1 LptF/LptG family permease [Kiritimatiellia bacterium]HMP96201.1 LptF/LptG family permease [Kiritimatiellia bacterium]